MHLTPRRLIRSSGIASLIALVVLVVGPGTIALAAEKAAASSARWSVQGTSQPGTGTQSTQADSSATTAATYPADCIPRSDNPHQSTTFSTNIDGKGWTTCRLQRPQEHVDSSLKRQDCWWVFCWWTTVG